MPYDCSTKQKQYLAAHYQNNKVRYRDNLKKRRAERKAWFGAMKAKMKCLHCPENDSRCLDFHHKDPSVKRDLLSYMVHQALSEAVILAEMAKCDVLCSNCHRKLHKEIGFGPIC